MVKLVYDNRGARLPLDMFFFKRKRTNGGGLGVFNSASAASKWYDTLHNRPAMNVNPINILITQTKKIIIEI